MNSKRKRSLKCQTRSSFRFESEFSLEDLILIFSGFARCYLDLFHNFVNVLSDILFADSAPDLVGFDNFKLTFVFIDNL